MAQRTSAIPDTAGQVRDQLLKFKPSGPSVDEARAAMLAAKEPAKTFRGGTRVPTFIQENRGEGGSTSVTTESPVTVHAPQNEIPEPSRNVEVTDTRVLRALRYNAQQKLRQAGHRNGESVSLVEAIQAGTITKEEAEALVGHAIEGTDLVPTQETPEPEAATTPAEPPALSIERVPAEPETDVIEEADFTAKIFRDGKLWILEIQYKNGAGTERFSAPNKNELLRALARGKGHATLKIRQVSEDYKKRVREATLGEPDTWDFYFNLLHEAHGLTVEDYNALPEKSREVITDDLQSVEAMKFLKSYPEYYGTEENFKTMGDFLNQKKWPLTAHNLEIAYARLSALGLLEEKPIERVDAPAAAPVASVAPEVSAQPVAPPVEDSTVAPTPAASPLAPAPAPAAAPVRKRAVSGLIPGSSSASSGSAERSEDRNKPRELSEKELRTMPMADLKRIATQGRKYGVRY